MKVKIKMWGIQWDTESGTAEGLPTSDVKVFEDISEDQLHGPGLEGLVYGYLERTYGHKVMDVEYKFTILSI